MEEKDVLKLWQESSNQQKINLDLNKLTMDLKRKVNQVDRRVKRRDMKEIIGSIIGGVFHIYLLFEVPYMLTKVGCLIITLWFGYVVYRLLNASKQESSNFLLSFKDQIKSKKSFLIKQRRLLDSVLYWYVIPPFIGNVFFLFGLGFPKVVEWDSIFAGIVPDHFASKVIAILFIAVLYLYIYSQNKKAVKVNYDPLIKEIDQLEREFGTE